MTAEHPVGLFAQMQSQGIARLLLSAGNVAGFAADGREVEPHFEGSAADDLQQALRSMRVARHQSLSYRLNVEAGLRMLVAIHSSRPGRPFANLVRVRADEVDELQATHRALRQSRIMSYKCAAAGIRAGGGKLMVYETPATNGHRPAGYHAAVARVIDESGAICGADLGVGSDEAAELARLTPHIIAMDDTGDGIGTPGDSAAIGVYVAMRLCCAEKFGDPSLRDRRVLIQGVGRVGQPLARLVAASGGRLFVSDISDKSIEALRAWVPEFERVPAESALRTGCDVLAPCADADVLDEATIPELHCKVVCGSANHPLRNPDEEAAMLADRDILYAVDWVANVGGVITADEAYHALRARRRLDGHRVLAHTLAAVTEGLGRVFARARETGSDPYKAAVDLFEPVIYGE